MQIVEMNDCKAASSLTLTHSHGGSEYMIVFGGIHVGGSRQRQGEEIGTLVVTVNRSGYARACDDVNQPWKCLSATGATSISAIP